MKANSQYRAQAREILRGEKKNTAIVGVVFLVLALITEVPGLCTMNADFAVQTAAENFTTLYAVLVLAPVQFAVYCAFLGFTRGEITSDGLLNAVKSNFRELWSRTIPTYLLMLIIIIGISIVTLGIGGIIFSLAYGMVPYLLKDYPSLSVRETLQVSRGMMKGHKWEFFLLQLSFVGWALLCILTAGIGFIALVPYQATTFAYYYEDLKSETIIEEE